MTDINAKAKFIEYLKSGDWKYEELEDGVITGRIQYSNERPGLALRFNVTFESGCICNTAAILAISDRRVASRMMRIVLNVNKDLLWGGFDLDMEEKRLFYKLTFPYRLIGNVRNMDNIFDDILFLPCVMARECIDKFLRARGE